MKSLLTIAIKAALVAGAEILKIYETDFNVETKDDASPLTQADKNANTAIMKYLLNTDIPIISEENRQLDYEERKDWKRCWIVDPLDGTKEFIKRNGEFTVNIALVEEGTPIMGVIYVPVSKTLYFASKGLKTSKKITLTSEATTVSYILEHAEELQPQAPTDVIKIVGSRSHLNQDTKDYTATVEQESKKRVSIVSKGVH